jgi:hypothetical protein
MANITLQFPRNSYPSLQVGDIGYYAIMQSSTLGGFQVNTNTDDLVEIGAITTIDNTTSLTNGTLTTSITFNMGDDVDPPTSSNFILFSKNNVVNTGSLLGYYGSITFKNSSTDKAEMFSAACEITQSSK